MNERRQPKIKIGRRKSDIPVVALERFKDEMKDHVAETIERVVNGKIKDIDFKLTTYIEEDMKWKESMEPLREAFTSSKWTFKMIVAILKVLALVSPAIGGFWLIRDYLKK